MGNEHRIFIERLLITAAFVLLLLVFWALRSLLILAFGAIVIAVLIRALAAPIRRVTGLGNRGSAFLAILVIAIVIWLTGWLFGRQIGNQFERLGEAVPAAWTNLKAQIRTLPLGDDLLQSLSRMSADNSNILERLGSLLVLLSTVATNLVVVLFGAVFLAVQPGLYRNGLLMLIPKSRRELGGQALDDSGRALKLWLVGQVISMLIVGVLTGVGLWLAGVPSPLALGLLAGLADIVPYAGPVAAAVPGLLLALLQGPETAFWALVVYIIVQQIEGNLILPVVQRHMVTLPPALTIFSIIAAGLLFGVMGVIFAAPLLVVIYVLVKRLYVREALHTDTTIPGEDDGAATLPRDQTEPSSPTRR